MNTVESLPEDAGRALVVAITLPIIVVLGVTALAAFSILNPSR